MTKIRIIGPFDEKVDVGIDCSVEPSMTKQSFKEECDINTLMARYERTGVMDFANENEARYGDATAIDFQVAQNLVISAKQMFDDMPGKLRQRFNNDPAVFLDYIDNPENIDESISLGLRKAPIAPLTSPESLPLKTPSVGVSAAPSPT